MFRRRYDLRIATLLQIPAAPPAPPAPGTASAFAPLGLTHGLTLAVLILLFAAVCIHGRRLRRTNPNRERRFATTLAITCLVGWVFQQAYFLGVVRDLHESLPLHFCDLAALIGPLALLTTHPPSRRFFRTILFFWAFALTTQGLITPTVEHGPDHPRFFLFWLNHGSVVLLALYDTAVRRYRPTYRDVWVTILVTWAYAAALVPLNLALKTNYGFTGNTTPGVPTILDSLGTWPTRLFWMALVVAAACHAVWLIRASFPGEDRTTTK